MKSVEEIIIDKYNKFEKCCLVDDCEEEALKLGLCEVHLKMKIRYGTVELEKVKEIRLCSKEGCLRKHYSKGLCNKHYRENFPEKFKCVKKNKLNGKKIKLKKKRKKELKDNKLKNKKSDDLCKVDGCNRRAIVRGFCNQHDLNF